MWSISLVIITLATGGSLIAQPPAESGQGVQALQNAVISSIARAEKSVVAIARIPKDRNQRSAGILDLQRQFLDPDQLPQSRIDPKNPDYLPGHFSSGVIIDRQGHIVTTFHSLGDPKRHDYVVWIAGTAFEATRVKTPPAVLAGDPWTDLAILKIEPAGTPIELGNAESIRKGTFVVALGNPYALARDGRPSAASGIVANLRRAAPPRVVSADRRPKDTLSHYGTLIQVDLKLPFGSSGGALVNLKGELIGLTSSLAPLVGYESSAGFAIPVDSTFRYSLERLKTGRVPAFGFLGLQPDNLTASEKRLIGGGARVVRLVSGAAASLAGIAIGDIITHVDGRSVNTRDDVIREISRLPAHQKVKLAIRRLDPDTGNHHLKELDVDLSKKPIETEQLPYESVAPKRWRGILIEESTAIPQALRRQNGSVPDPNGCVGILEVAKDSPAWRAGLRPGSFISHVGGKRVSSPKEFFARTKNSSGDLELRLVGASSSDSLRTVPAQ